MKRKPPPQRDTAFSGVVFFALAVLAAMGAALCFLSSLQLPRAAAAYWGVGVGLAAMLGLFCLPQKGRRRGLLAATGAFAVAAGLCWGRVLRGAAYTLQWIAHRFFLVFPGLGTAPAPYGLQAQADSGLFLLFAALLVGAYVCWAVLWRKSLLLCLAGTLPLFAFVTNLYALTHLAGTVMLLAAWAALLCKGQLGRFRPPATAARSAAALGLAAVYLCLLVVVWPAGAYRAAPDIFDTRWRITNWAADLYASSPFGSGQGALRGAPLAGRRGRVNLAQTGQLRYGEETALRVRGYSTGGLYLRAYSAGVYTGQSWQQLPGGAYEEESFGFQPLTYMPLQYTMTQERRQSVAEQKEEMEIEAVNANPAYAYTPYLLAGVGSEGEYFMFEQDAAIRPTNGSRRYTALTYSYMDSVRNMVKGSLDASLVGATHTDIEALLGGDQWVWATTAGEGGTEQVTYAYSDAPEWYAQAPPDEEAAYLQFLSRQYLQLPEGLGDTLRLLAAQAGIQRPAEGPQDWYKKALQVAEFVCAAATYTRSPGSQPRDQDFVVYFLTQSRRGYCVHFATAAVAMLRALGVPARYVEGYVCGEKVGAQNWTDIPSTSAHAWAEIWVPHYGWLPLEATPGGADNGRTQTREQQEKPPEIQLRLPAESGVDEASSSGAASSAPVAPSAPSSTSQGEPAPAGGQGEGGEKAARPPWGKGVLWVAAAIALGLGLLWAARRYAAALRARRFAQKDTNKAALALYRYLVRLRWFGYRPTSEAQQLAGKARFSQHTLTGAERGALGREAAEARGELLDTLPWYKGLLFRLLGL